MDLSGKHIVTVGIGVTGLATAAFCQRRGARVTVIDAARNARTEAAAEALRPLGVAVELGSDADHRLAEADLVVLSPGVPHDLPAILHAADRGARIMGEIELASRFIQIPIIAITGTNGKTTTTTLLGEMLRASGKSVFVGGNIGEPLIGFADAGKSVDWVVLEVSSFQLDTIDTFRPRIGVILNVADDHLDRYPDLAAYGASKLRLLANQGPDDVAVLNGEDRFIRSRENSRGRRLVFQRSDFEGEGARIREGRIVLAVEGKGPVEVDLTDSLLNGRHNEENIAAAALANMVAGGTADGIRKAIRNFRGLPHRLEWIATVDGVRYFNDSKATNVDAVVRAVESFNAPMVLIMGGLDKGGSYKPLEDLVRKRVRRLVLLGEATPVIAETLGHLVPADRANNMKEAVRLAAAASTPGDVVLLSPACASFDMYSSYAERGADFTRAVKAMEE